MTETPFGTGSNCPFFTLNWKDTTIACGPQLNACSALKYGV
jgi:hypothetical protein